MTVLVTGATGFLGHHLLNVFAAGHSGTPLCVVARNRATWDAAPQSALHPSVQVVEAPLHDAAAILAALGAKGLGPGAISCVFHLAASVHHSRQGGQALFDGNVRGTEGMVALAGALGARLVFVSTSGTVACHREPGTAADELAPFCVATVARWPYYASKIASERLVAAAVAAGQLEAVVVRPPVMLGPYDHRFRATSLIVKYLRGKLPFYLSGGMHFVDIRDAAAALVRAMELPHPRPVYHLAGHAMSLQAYFAALEHASGTTAPKHRLPGPLAAGLAYITAGKLFDPVVIEMGQHHWDMGSRFAHELGFSPRPVQETLGDTVGWLRAHHPQLSA